MAINGTQRQIFVHDKTAKLMCAFCNTRMVSIAYAIGETMKEEEGREFANATMALRFGTHVLLAPKEIKAPR